MADLIGTVTVTIIEAFGSNGKRPERQKKWSVRDRYRSPAARDVEMSCALVGSTTEQQNKLQKKSRSESPQ